MTKTTAAQILPAHLANAGNQVAPRWVYLVERLNEHKPFEDQTVLNWRGGEGWELVAVRGAYAYFKKPGVQDV